MQKKIKILVVDDEAIMRESLRDWLTDSGYNVLTAENSSQALEIVRREKPGLAIIDLVLPGTDGLEVLKKAKQEFPNLQVVMMTAYGSVNTAISAMKEGAYDYIEKPFTPEKIELLVAEMLEKQALLEDGYSLKKIPQSEYIFENIVAKSESMKKIVEMIKVIAKSKATVLISGESGSGKEVVARAIHSLSYQNAKPFISLSCAHLPGTLLESELFGHEAGAFPNVQTSRKGKLEVVEGGTLFLNQVNNLDSNIQVHLLRTLEEGTFSRMGGSESIQLNIHLISATSKDMKKLIKEGQFREDLYYRLSVVNIELPPLRERKEDIPVLADYFLMKFNEKNQKKVAGLSAEASDFILRYGWPGNVREMENAMERAVILAKDDIIEVSDFAQHDLPSPNKALVDKTLQEMEKSHILAVLMETGGNCSEAARLLGISRMTLYNKIKTYGLNIGRNAS